MIAKIATGEVEDEPEDHGKDLAAKASARGVGAGGGLWIQRPTAEPQSRPGASIARFARGTGIRGVETASRLHLKTRLKFDIACRNPIGRRAGRTGFDWVAGPISPQLVQRFAFIIYTGLEIRRLRVGRSRRL